MSTTTATLPVATPKVTLADLTLADRCDRCGSAAARAVATLPSGGQLLLCVHHADKAAPGLAAAGATLEISRY